MKFMGKCCDCGKDLPGICRRRFEQNPNRRCQACHTATYLPEGTERLRGDGYVRVKVAGQWELKHRQVMEQELGRPLASGEVVHHDNEHRADNYPENLVLCPSPGKHVEEHHPDALEHAIAVVRTRVKHEQARVICRCGFRSRRVLSSGGYGSCPRCNQELAPATAGSNRS